MAKIEEEYEDVLQNIEFAIVGVYREHSELQDYDVEKALNALLVAYQAEQQQRSFSQVEFTPLVKLVYEHVRSMCEWRLGRGNLLRAESGAELLQPSPLSLDEIVACVAVGWCLLTPRDALPWLDRARLFGRVDDAPVWSISCFYVRQGYRKQGVMSALIAAALKAAKRAKAPALEAYPVDTGAPDSTSNVFTGIASTFARAGFKTVACRTPSRPIMRHDLKGIGR